MGKTTYTEIKLHATHTKTRVGREVVHQGPGIRQEELHLVSGKFQTLSATPTLTKHRPALLNKRISERISLEDIILTQSEHVHYIHY